MVSLTKARMAKKKFLKSKYYDRKRMMGCGISRVGKWNGDAIDEKDDYCIVINFRNVVRFLELEAVIPEKYYGVQIYAKVTGEITAQ